MRLGRCRVARFSERKRQRSCRTPLQFLRSLFLPLPTVNCRLSTSPMHWFERRIRRYEHRRWTTDDNRRVQPIHWGLEHIGGDPADSDPAAYVHQFAKQAIENSAAWYATTPATDYKLDAENVLTF